MKSISPNDYGKNFLTDQCQNIKLSDFLKVANIKLKRTLMDSLIEAEGYKISFQKSKAGFNGIRLWFSCPVCKRKTGILYKHPLSQILGCRRCLKLDYRSHRYRGMLEGKKIIKNNQASEEAD